MTLLPSPVVSYVDLALLQDAVIAVVTWMDLMVLTLMILMKLDNVHLARVLHSSAKDSSFLDLTMVLPLDGPGEHGHWDAARLLLRPLMLGNDWYILSHKPAHKD